METNAGVTGLNYQRMKSVFFPHTSFTDIELEMDRIDGLRVFSSMCSMIFERDITLAHGGFVLDTPAPTGLCGADFAKAMLFDIACAVKRSHDVLMDISPNDKEIVYGCGFKGHIFPQMVADLLGKQVVLRQGFTQSSILGCVQLCNRNFDLPPFSVAESRAFTPCPDGRYAEYYDKCETMRLNVDAAYNLR